MKKCLSHKYAKNASFGFSFVMFRDGYYSHSYTDSTLISWPQNFVLHLLDLLTSFTSLGTGTSSWLTISSQEKNYCKCWLPPFSFVWWEDSSPWVDAAPGWDNVFEEKHSSKLLSWSSLFCAIFVKGLDAFYWTFCIKLLISPRAWNREMHLSAD